MSTFYNIFSKDNLDYIVNLPEVKNAIEKLNDNGKVYFTIPLTDPIRTDIEKLGLNLSGFSEIPMRWIIGDTPPHIDAGSKSFEKTYLIYLNDSPGELIIDNTSFLISKNKGYVFNEGLSHRTQNTGMVPRLLVGPMSEFIQPVGGLATYYYATQSDATSQTNYIGYSYITAGTSNFTVGNVDYGTNGGYTSWKIATGSNGSSSQSATYQNGDTLIGDGYYYLYPSSPCFLDGTKILCQVDRLDTYLPIESITSGTLVKTSSNGYKKVELIGKGEIHNPGNKERILDRIYKCPVNNYPELTDDLYITGCHSILVDELTDLQREETVKHLGRIFVTDKKYRLLACIDDRSEPWDSEGNVTIWHIALENENDKMNYGIYANGLLVESCPLYFLKNKSNMDL